MQTNHTSQGFVINKNVQFSACVQYPIQTGVQFVWFVWMSHTNQVRFVWFVWDVTADHTNQAYQPGLCHHFFFPFSDCVRYPIQTGSNLYGLYEYLIETGYGLYVWISHTNRQRFVWFVWLVWILHTNQAANLLMINWKTWWKVNFVF